MKKLFLLTLLIIGTPPTSVKSSPLFTQALTTCKTPISRVLFLIAFFNEAKKSIEAPIDEQSMTTSMKIGAKITLCNHLHDRTLLTQIIAEVMSINTQEIQDAITQDLLEIRGKIFLNVDHPIMEENQKEKIIKLIDSSRIFCTQAITAIINQSVPLQLISIFRPVQECFT